ncbi:MAG: TRAP transporter small permease subunit [Lentilitoribacter sp.]|jgi:TRAP-type C4-dicarboxylate transport system permease small subunit
MITAFFRRFFNGSINVAIVANTIGTMLIFALVAILNADVVARGILHDPINGVVELVIFSLALIVFLQLPDVVRSNRLTRSDGFLHLIHSFKPKVACSISRIIDLIAGVFMVLIAWTVWPEFVESYETCSFFVAPEFGPALTGNFMQDLSDAFGRCEYAGTPGIFTAPTWPVKLAIAFSVTLCAIIFLLKAMLDSDQTQLFGNHQKAMAETAKDVEA